MDMRQWLLDNGISQEELDTVEVPPVLNDIGEGLLLSLQNDDDIGGVLVMLMTQIDALTARIQVLEAR